MITSLYYVYISDFRVGLGYSLRPDFYFIIENKVVVKFFFGKFYLSFIIQDQRNGGKPT
jgi:hypothetical protein